MSRPAGPGGAWLAALAVLTCGAAPGGEGPAPANRLAGESSPYLLLHADNPVDWYPWGEEALARAREEDRPIFLSVGYSTCHWCHVMAREAFSDPETAALMNRWFVNVKVDREERPDLDEIYLRATQLLTRRGGWPNSVFLTPELEPFYAGTYFPLEERAGLPGFATVLRRVHDAWTNRREQVRADAGRLAAAIEASLSAPKAPVAAPAAAPPGPERAQAAVAQLAGAYDREWGGFGRAPKFPSPGNLFLLWEAGAEGGDERRMVLETLGAMGRGGIYDQLGGGFHRYATDRRWRLPHFEKMLYDNALLAELLALAWRETADPELARLARGTLDFVLAELTLPEGGFKSAIDAETGGEEGAYHVWTAAELRAALGEEGFALLAPIYGFDGEGGFAGGRHVLHLTAPLAEHAGRLGISRERLLERLEPHLERLREARGRRPPPRVDDKVLADWNGLAIAALARAGALLGEPGYLRAAERAASFVLARLDPPEAPLRHVWRAGEARIDAFLDDYAFLLRGLLALHEATGEPRWLAEAVRLADELEQRLAAPGGGYYAAAPDPGLLFQPLSATEGAVPSGNSVAVHALLDLARATGEPRFRERAERSLRAFARELEERPAAVPMLAAAALRLARDPAPGAQEAARAGDPMAGRQLAREPAPGAPAPGAQEAARAGDPAATADLEDLAREVASAAASAGPASGGWRPLEVRLRLRPGWHVNANPASDELLIPTRVEGAGEGEVRGMRYPEGRPYRFAFSETPVAVYDGELRLPGEVAAGATSVRLTYQACDDTRCLPPVTETLRLDAGGDR